jgi:ligand-binding sensor domain-containing protein/DNA-binding response OmpR family regulator/nitrogen-specific signal transduction histidine kinase
MKHTLCFFYFLLHLTLCSQNIQFDKLNIKNGLPDNSVRDIIKDKQGYLWFGTLNGLSRYDGKSFKNYYSIPGDTTSLTDSRMVQIREDKEGFIWCWSNDNSLQRVNPINNEVVNITKLILKNEVLGGHFSIVSNGDIWVWGNHGCARIRSIDNKGGLKADIFNEENGFENNIIHFVFEDKLRNIWIGTKTGLVKIILTNKGRTIKTYFKNIEFLSLNSFKNNIWFGTESDGVYSYSLKTNKFSSFDNLKKQFVKKPVLCVNQLNSKIVLLGSNRYLFEFNIEKNVVRPFHIENLRGSYVFFVDSYKDVWLITNWDGVFKYSMKEKKVEHYDLNAKDREFLGTADKLQILEDSNKNLWIGSSGGGLFLYDRVKNMFTNYKYNEEKVQSISSDMILSLFEDSSKNMWVGTLYGGVNKISLSKENFIWHRPVKNPSNVFENEIRASVEDKSGRLWVGSKGGKIFCYKNYELQYTFPDDLSEANKSKIKDINIYSLYIDENDNLWVGTKGKGLFVIKNIINTAPKNLEIVSFDKEKYRVLNNAYSIIQDKYKNFWIGSHVSGLSVLSNPFNNPKVITYTRENTSKQLMDNYIRYLFVDIDGDLWIGSSAGLNLLPVNQLRQSNKKFISFENIKKNIYSLSNNSVDHIFQASDKSIYVSTLGGGVNLLSYSNLKQKVFEWKHLDVSNGLTSNTVFAMQEDSEKNIWFSTSLGINKYYPRDGMVENFFDEKKYGLNYYSEGCVAKLSNGDFLFGHNKGFLTFNPKHIVKDRTVYPIVLSKFFVNGTEVLPRQSDLISRNIEYEKEVNLTYTQNTIRFDFAVLDYKDPEKIKYSYKLDNFDENWSIPLNNNSAIFQNLPPGEYIFMLKATNSDGVELPDIHEFKVNIAPPFLKSNLGYFLEFVFFGIIFFSFLYLYKKQISAKQEVLFTEKLNEKKLVYYTNISHEFKTPLTLISCHLQDIIEDENVSNETKSSTKQIQKSTTYLLNLVEQILDFRKIREEKMKLVLINTNIVDFIKNIHAQFLPLATKEGINLILDSKEDDIFGYIDINIMKKVVYNLLSNAVKFTPANKNITISLKLVKKRDFIKIKIKDQGKGISVNDQKNLFERFSKSENSSGIGLFYVKELVGCHKGKIKVDSVLGQGTCFTIYLPVSKNYYSNDEIEINEVSVDENNFYEPSVDNSAESEEEDTSINQTYSILIIDDNEEMRNYLSNKFNKFFNVFTAKNGEEGVQLAIKEIPDVIVCDLMMPVLDGIGAIKMLRENFNTCHIPIILLTANSSEQQRIEGIKTGADDYITKPFNFNYLKLKIDALISQRNKIIQSFSKNPELSMSILTNSEEDKNFIEKVNEIVEKSIGEADFNVNSIAATMGLSRTIFYKKTKEITDKTPHEFIINIQMKKAVSLLKNTNYTIAEISVICGFSDTSYFSKIFKKYFGMSPKAYQIKNKE